MALLFSDGFDNYTTALDMYMNWDLLGSPFQQPLGSQITIYKTGGATNAGFASYSGYNADPLGFAKSIPIEPQLYTACWFRISSSATNGLASPILQFSNAPVADVYKANLQDFPAGYNRITIAIDYNFRLCIMHNGTTVATGTKPIVNLDWRHLEIYQNWSSGSDGSVEVRLNGVTEVTYAGVTWDGSGQNGVSWITCGSIAGGSDGSAIVGYDDVLIYTPGGDAPNTWIGPQVIETLRPIAAGSITQGTPTPVLNNTTDSGAHLYWRLRISDVYLNTVADIAKLDFLSTLNGQSLCQGGTAIASGYSTTVTASGGQYPMIPAYAFDNLASTVWGSPNPAVGSWIGYKFNAAVDPKAVMITPGADIYTNVFTCSLDSFVIEYSDDGNAWSLASSFSTSSTWTAGEMRYFPIVDGNFARIYEQTPDSDVSYVEFDAVGAEETYLFNPTSDPARVITLVAVNLTTKGSGASPRKVAGLCKSGAQLGLTDTVDVAPLSNYHAAQTLFYTDPNTGAAWTAAGLNAAEFGLKLVL